MIGFNVPIYIKRINRLYKRKLQKVEKFVVMEHLLKNVVNGWKINLMLIKY